MQSRLNSTDPLIRARNSGAGGRDRDGSFGSGARVRRSTSGTRPSTTNGRGADATEAETLARFRAVSVAGARSVSQSA
jgi:hypothetical protein